MDVLLVTGPTLPEKWMRSLINDFATQGVHLKADIADKDVAYALAWKPPHGRLAELPNLKAIFSFGAGVDHVLEDAALPAVPVIRAATDDLAERMSEYVVWQALYHHRRGADYAALQAKAEWRPLGQPKASDRTVGILGYGRLGAHAAARLQAVGFHVAGWSRSPKAEDGTQQFHGPDGLKSFLAGSDIVVCLLPLTDETRGILSGPLFDQMQDGAALIHVGRGEQLVPEDLLAALERGKLSAATLDVVPDEPLPASSPLWAHPRIVLTPHVASTTDGKALGAQVAEAIEMIEAGHTPPNIVDVRRGY